MRRVYFVVEGQTEAEFVREVLGPYFQEHGIFDVRAVLIETSEGHRGGFVKYSNLKKLVVRLLKEESGVLVTTMVDFFRLPNDLPAYKECMKAGTASSKIECLQRYLAEDISKEVTDIAFLPYIQQYEFEALLFSSAKGFVYIYGEQTSAKIAKIINAYPSPEDINDSPATAPSKRLLDIIPDYQKIIDGNILALEVGVDNILEKCPRFRGWIERLIFIARK